MADTVGLTMGDTSLFNNFGIAPTEFFSGIASSVLDWASKGLQGLKDLAQNILAGAAEVGGALLRGDFKLFSDFFKEKPWAGGAAVVAVVLTGGLAVAGIAAGVGAVVAGLSAITGGAIVTATVLPGLMQKMVAAGQTLYNFDLNKSDNKIWEELKNSYENFIEIAGEETGRAMAGIIINKNQIPKLKVDLTATATLFLLLEEEGRTELHEEILESLAQVAWAIARHGRDMAIKLGYMNARKWARSNLRTGIDWVDKWIQSWGTDDKAKPLSIASTINTTIEKIKKGDKAMGTFLENFVEGFGDGISDFVEYI